ncbi:hypothetical protein C8P63_111111 [Melghirimyces profundicolus]|uniref:Polyketide cyclase/dehydrase/lipid transport protein n=1 Tax=Melghirimyces profundicolus TaxID=1242148 RepID=A0A2T6BUG1_9BACL|nr:hypothetical protein [Melghirimyces profundicolus]PTX59676.1 hypothetical protein C8P63_111111 [Melghirimyces profundicolus]
MHLTLETGVQTSREHLFDCLETEGQLKQWVPRMQRLTYEEMPKEGSWKGALFTLHFGSGKKEQKVKGEIVAHRKPELFGVRLHLSHGILDLFISLEEADGEVTMSCDCEVSVAEGGNRLKARLMAWQIRRSLPVYLKSLKHIAESRPMSA